MPKHDDPSVKSAEEAAKTAKKSNSEQTPAAGNKKKEGKAKKKKRPGSFEGKKTGLAAAAYKEAEIGVAAASDTSLDEPDKSALFDDDESGQAEKQSLEQTVAATEPAVQHAESEQADTDVPPENQEEPTQAEPLAHTDNYVVPGGISTNPLEQPFAATAVKSTITGAPESTAQSGKHGVSPDTRPGGVSQTGPIAPYDRGAHTGQVIEDQLAAKTADGELAIQAGNNLFAAKSYNGAYGELHLASDGHWTFELNNQLQTTQQLGATEQVEEVFNIVAKDGTSHEIHIFIHGTEDNPVITSIAARSVTEGAALLKGQVAATDVDHGDTLSFSTSAQIAGLQFNPDGSYTFDPTDPTYNNLPGGAQKQLNIPVTVTDSVGGSSTRILHITINGTNDKAVIAGTSVGAVTEDSHLTTSGTLTVTDPDAGQAAFVAQTGTAGTYGTFTVDAGGQWSYDLDNTNPKVQGLTQTDQLTDTLTVTSKDGTTQQITVTINGTDDKAVIAGTAAGSVTEDTQLNTSGTLTVTDPDAGQAGFIPQTGAAGTYGTFTIDAGGQWSYDLDNTDPKVQGLTSTDQLTDTITVSTRDGTTQQITVTINGTDDKAVIAGTAAGSVTEDTQLTTSGTLTVTDPDAGQAGFIPQTGTAGTYGTFTIDAGGQWSYDLDNTDPKVQGLTQTDQLTDTITVSTRDGTTQQITVTINGTDDKAVIAGTAAGSVTEDTHLTTSGTLTVTDPDAGQAAFVAQTGTAGTYGTFTIDARGQWSYDLDNTDPKVQGLTSTDQLTDTLTVTSKDGTTQQITVTINGTDDKAVIAGTAAGSVTEDTQLNTSGTLSVTDPDAGQAAFVAQTGTAGTYGTFTIDAGGQWSYDLDNTDPKVQGLTSTDQLTDTLTVTSKDGTTQQITVTINGTDDKAVIGGVDSGDAAEASAGDNMSPDHAQPGMGILNKAPLYVDGKLTIVDPDAGEAVFETRGPGYNYHGIYGDLMLNADGSWHYVADAGNTATVGGLSTTRGVAIDRLGDGQTLIDTITVHSRDGSTHDITITIHGSNDRPYCSSEVTLAAGTEDTAQTLTRAQLLAKSEDVDANDAGKLDIAALRVDHGSVRDNQDGTYTFTPEKDYNGAVHFTFDVQDAHGGVTHTGATTNLTAVGDAAVVTGDTIGSVTEDRQSLNQTWESVSGVLKVVDPDAGEAVFSTSVTRIDDPFSTRAGEGLQIFQDGRWEYRVDDRGLQHLAEGETRTVVYEVSTVDGTTQRINIDVHGTNDRPELIFSGYGRLGGWNPISTDEDKAVTIPVDQFLWVATDTDHGASMHLEGLKVDHGTVTMTPDGQGVIFTPEKDYHGQVTFTYYVADEHGLRAGDPHVDSDKPAAVGMVMSVHAVADAAVITGQDTGDVTEDRNTYSPVSFLANQIHTSGQLTVTDADSGEDRFEFKSFIRDAMHPEWAPYTSAMGGRVSITPKGQWEYVIDTTKPEIQRLGVTDTLTDTVKVHSMDGTDHTITITIHGTNDAPVLQAQSQSVTEDGSLLSGRMVATDVDTGDTLTYSPPAQLVDGFTLNPDGSYTFDPSSPTYQHLAAGQTEKVTIPVTVTDSAGATSTRNLEITVTGTNDAPVVAPLTDTVDEDIASHSLDLLSGATDPEGDSLAVSGMQFTVNGAATSGPPPGVTIGTDGHTLYIDTTGQAYQHLAPGQQEQIKVSYIVEDGHGGQTQQTATLTVEGQDDKATLVSNVIQMTETVAYETSMVGHSVRGHLQLNDPDDGAPREFVFSGSYAGQGYAPGHLYVWPDGSYEFNLEWASNRYARDAVNSLKSGETLEYKYNVQTADHQTKEVIIRITGEDDAARITVDPVLPARQTIYEDHLVPGGAGHNLYAGGILRVIDPDHDEAGIKPQSITTPEGGHFYINARGSWSFVIGNSLPVVQQLGIGDSIIKTFTVESIDGSATHDIKVTIQGTNDAPVLTAQTQSVTEDGSLLSGQMIATDVDTGDTQSFTAANPPPGFTLGTDGSYSFDPTDQAYQHLAAGQTEMVSIPVTVTDSAGATSTRNLEITVTGTNDAPVVSQAVTLAPGTEDKAVTIDPADLLAHATDVDGDTLGVANLHADHGSLSLNPDGTYSFTPEQDYNGRVTFTYEVTDGQGGRATQSASMNLAAVADKPVIDIDIADTADNVLNAKEITAATISGNIDAGSTLDSIDVTDGAQTITLQGANVTVDASGHYRVSGVDLSSLADGALTVTAHATSTDGTSGISTDTITKDAAVGKISIHMENAGSDHEYSRAEVGSDGTVTATISLPQDALAGDTLTVNSVDHVLTTQDISAGQVDYQVHPSDSLIAVLTDQAGNRSDVESVQVANLAPDHPTFVTPPVIQNHGVPTITATIGDGSGGSGGWALEGPDGRAVQHATGKYGTLTIDPQTGQLSYEYSHAATMGQKAQGGTHSAGETISQTDHDVFHVLLHSSRHGDVDVEVNVNIEFIHGRSGQNRDTTQLVSMTITDPAGGQANDEIPDQADVFSATLDAADDEQPQGDTVSEYVNIFAQAGADVREPDRASTRSADLPEGLEDLLSEKGAEVHEVGPDHSLDPAALADVLDQHERQDDKQSDHAHADLDQPVEQPADDATLEDPSLQQHEHQ